MLLVFSFERDVVFFAPSLVCLLLVLTSAT